MDPFFSPMVKTLNKNLLKHAAGTAIFCPICDKCADARRWVLATHGGVTRSVCSSCWDSATAGKVIPTSVDVVDGRKVFARTRTTTGGQHVHRTT